MFHRLRRWLTTDDGRVAAALLLVPLVAFVVPALFGAPALSGDNLIQNFPGAFSGELLRQGQLPLWNPFIWSGSPLLGGMNAGSFFPGTFLFVGLPPIGAWVLNMTAIYWVAGLGTFWLLREYGMRPLAGFLGAVVYAYSGVMIGQMVHLGIIQGMAMMPGRRAGHPQDQLGGLRRGPRHPLPVHPGRPRGAQRRPGRGGRALVALAMGGRPRRVDRPDHADRRAAQHRRDRDRGSGVDRLADCSVSRRPRGLPRPPPMSSSPPRPRRRACSAPRGALPSTTT